MISNPIQHDLFGPTGTTLGALFLIGLLGILIAERGNLRNVISGSLFRRWRTWAVIAPV
jgi:phosphatidate cytidylyltransferase